MTAHPPSEELWEEGDAVDVAPDGHRLARISASPGGTTYSLSTGADEYLVKPFGLDELSSRSRALSGKAPVRGSWP